MTSLLGGGENGHLCRWPLLLEHGCVFMLVLNSCPLLQFCMGWCWPPHQDSCHLPPYVAYMAGEAAVFQWNIQKVWLFEQATPSKIIIFLKCPMNVILGWRLEMSAVCSLLHGLQPNHLGLYKRPLCEPWVGWLLMASSARAAGMGNTACLSYLDCKISNTCSRYSSVLTEKSISETNPVQYCLFWPRY